MGEGVNPPALGGAPFPVGNNSMPPVASPRLGTSGCDYTGRIEFDKKQDFLADYLDGDKRHVLDLLLEEIKAMQSLMPQ